MKKCDELKRQGISEIICTAVNDPFVLNAWGKDLNTRKYCYFPWNFFFYMRCICVTFITTLNYWDADVFFFFFFAPFAAGKVRMLADPKGEFAKAIDLTVDMPNLGGLRSKRYSMVVDDGIVKQLLLEPDGTGISCTLADNIKVN